MAPSGAAAGREGQPLLNVARPDDGKLNDLPKNLTIDQRTSRGDAVDEQEGKPAINPAERNALMEEIKQRFDVELLWYERLTSPGYREDVTTHGFFDTEDRLTDDLKQEIRRWLEGRGWQFSRQMRRLAGDDHPRTEHIFLAPIIPVPLKVGYHATRRTSVPSIMEKGLLPSAPERQTTENRWDCEGNIYLCGRLGTTADVGVPGSESAYWWRDHLAQKNRFADPDWVILRVEVGRLEGALTYRDIWSKSGLIVGNVAVIPPELIRLE